MRRTLRGSQVLCLSLLLTVGLLAATAATAQAGEFRVNKSTFSASKITSETFSGEVGESKFSVAWLGFEIICTGATLSGTATQGGAVSVNSNFKGCVVAKNKFCTLYPTEKDLESETSKGEIWISGKAGSVLLHGGSHYVRFPQQLFTILFIGGAGCTLQEVMEATGSAAVKLPSALTELVKQPFSAVAGKTESALLEVSVRCAGEPAEILGSEGSLSLSGANAGKTWELE
jgi:hypothetical protein